MKVLVTGSNGFIGRNLCQHLKEMKDVEVLPFDKDDNFSIIEKNIKDIGFIFHLAGINRPEKVDEFYSGNRDLTKTIIDLLKENKLKTPLLISSSIQAVKDNDYGKSKKEAEDIVFSYDKDNTYVFRLHNVFGKWCRPNYNSVVATFCYNVSHNLEITVNDIDAELELVYIDDVIEEFINVLNGNKPTKKEGNYCYVTPTYKIKLGALAEMIKSFKVSMESIMVPKTGEEFTKKLFSTYLSYVELDNMVYTPKTNTDDRGIYTELIRTLDCGQVSVSISKKGVSRGNHYHHTKIEKFIVVKGSAKITFKHIITGELKEYVVDDKELKIVNVPVGYTHKIENTSEDDMILLIWSSQLFDSNKPDTYMMEVK